MNLKYRIRQINVALQQGIVGNTYRRAKRAVAASRRLPGGAPKSKTANFRSLSLPRLNIKTVRMSLILFTVIALLLVGLVSYLGINPRPSELDWDHIYSKLVSDKVNTMVLVTEKSNEYTFVDFIAVISASATEEGHKIIVINPDITSSVLGKEIKIRNTFSNSLVQNKSPMTIMHSVVEGLIGIKLDRYIEVSRKDLGELIPLMNISLKVEHSLVDEYAGTFTEGEVVSGERLVDYMAAIGEGWDEKLVRQSKFVESLLRTQMGADKLLLAIIRSGELAQKLHTNMTREELISYFLQLNGSAAAQVAYLGSRESYYKPEILGYIPDYNAVDTKVRGLFARVDVQKEQARIEVYNGTRTAGLASRTQRLLENLGGNVIRSSNSPQLEERTKLYVSRNRELYPNNIELISQTMANQLIIVEEEYPFQHAGELVLVIGRDFTDRSE